MRSIALFILTLLSAAIFTVCVSHAHAETLEIGEHAQWVEIEVSSAYFQIPSPTSKVKRAITCYLDCVQWNPYPPPVPGESSCLAPGLPTIDLGGVGWLHDGRRVAAAFLVDEELSPVGSVVGQETPEFRAMITALKSFRKRHPFRHTDFYEDREKQRRAESKRYFEELSRHADQQARGGQHQ